MTQAPTLTSMTHRAQAVNDQPLLPPAAEVSLKWAFEQEGIEHGTP